MPHRTILTVLLLTAFFAAANRAGAGTGAQPIRLLIVYMGAEGAANVIPQR
jgi:hypothetical protein